MLWIAEYQIIAIGIDKMVELDGSLLPLKNLLNK